MIIEQNVINGDNIELLKKYPDNYFDAVVTDPPYGLGKEPNAEELMKDWIEKGYHEISGKGFMGKEWDAFVPQPIFWQEVFRVLKPGGHVLAFYGTRTYDWGVMAMRFAGFEVRDCIQWLYGSGFPKSHNISKALDKMQGAEMETKGQSEWEGWGTALKPANEPIVLARKPLEKGLSIAENILKWGVGGINIDASRVETSFADNYDLNKRGISKGSGIETNINFTGRDLDLKHGVNNVGRFPANIILDEVAAEILDEQSGVLKSGEVNKNYIQKNRFDISKDGKGGNLNLNNSYSDKGGASRFFYVAKASKSERNKGLEDFEEKIIEGRDEGQDERGVAFKARPTPMANIHPTVKPIKLMQYLVKMITPPNGVVLDPFCGSGTTGVACKIDGFNFVGLEQDIEYAKIANARISNYKLELKQIDLF